MSTTIIENKLKLKMNELFFKGRDSYIRFISLQPTSTFGQLQGESFFSWSFNIKTGRKLKRNHFGHKNAPGQLVNKNFLFRKSDYTAYKLDCY